MREKLPKSQACLLCGVNNPLGLKLDIYHEDGRVSSEVTLPGWWCGYQGIAHGGIVATLLDELMGWAANCCAQGPTTTGELTVRFRQSIPLEQPLHVEAEVTRRRNRLIYASGRLYLPDGVLGAEATAKLLTQETPQFANEACALVYEPGDRRLTEEVV